MENLFGEIELLLGSSFMKTLSSKQKGSHLVIVGSVHGNERVGAQIIEKYYKYLSKNNNLIKKGKVSFIIGNPKALKLNQRAIEEDLNRAFFSKSSSYEALRAKSITEFLKQSKNQDYKFSDVLCDLHSVTIGEFRMVAIPKDEKINKLAEEISPLNFFFKFKSSDIGSLISGSCQLGYIALGIECGNHFSKDAFSIALEHINNLLMKFEILEKKDLIKNTEFNKITIEKEKKIYEVLEVIKKKENFKYVNPKISSETLIKKGEIFAEAKNYKYIAKEESFLLMPMPKPKDSDKDVGFLCKKLSP